MNRDEIKQILKKYIPLESIGIISGYLTEHSLQLNITRNRSTKSGDYRAPTPKKPFHRISINHNLNPYAFLITLLHELAHMDAFIRFGGRIKPHGDEWQSSFIRLARPVIKSGVFPDDLHPFVINHLQKGYASTFTDTALRKALDSYDKPEGSSDPATVYLSDIPDGSCFMLKNGRSFIKGKLLRNRYKCIDMNNQREYRVHSLAEVKIIQNPNK